MKTDAFSSPTQHRMPKNETRSHRKPVKPSDKDDNTQTAKSVSTMAKEECFPQDTITDILVHLPVKSLLRFRSVSKSWRSLINDNDFIKRHHKVSRETHSDLHLIITDLESDIWRVEVDSLRKAVRMNCPFKSKEHGVILAGSCNGFLCISKPEKDIVLWNPLTKASHSLPMSPSEVNPDSETYEHCSMQYDFGYDPINDDYKVLRMVLAYGGVTDYFCSDVRLYNLKSNSWKKITDIPIFVSMLDDPNHSGDYTGAAACVDGVLYWAINLRNSHYDHSFIIGFDLRDEKFLGNVPHPKFLQDDFSINVAVLEGKLCIMCNYSRVHADLWVMTEHRVNESWEKLFSIIQECPGILIPLTYSESKDKVLFAHGKRLAWYDLKRRSVKNVKIRGAPESFCVTVCQGNLVSPNIGSGRDERKISTVEEKVNKNKKKRNGFLSTGFKLKL